VLPNPLGMEIYVVYYVHIMKDLRCWMEEPRPSFVKSFVVMFINLNVPYNDAI
jgi:hypothetical protein